MCLSELDLADAVSVTPTAERNPIGLGGGEHSFNRTSDRDVYLNPSHRRDVGDVGDARQGRSGLCGLDSCPSGRLGTNSCSDLFLLLSDLGGYC